MHYKGVNDLDKVVLHEVRGSSAEVPICHSRELPGMFRLPDPDVNPRLLPWCCLKLDFSVAAPTFSLSYIAYVCYKRLRRFRCMLQLFHLNVAKVDREMLHMLHMLQVFQKHVASVCSRCFICFQTYVAIVFYLDVAYVSHICCDSMFQIF
jgi:hypothetical protein